jgi:hypothetical protein
MLCRYQSYLQNGLLAGDDPRILSMSAANRAGFFRRSIQRSNPYPRHPRLGHSLPLGEAALGRPRNGCRVDRAGKSVWATGPLLLAGGSRPLSWPLRPKTGPSVRRIKVKESQGASAADMVRVAGSRHPCRSRRGQRPWRERRAAPRRPHDELTEVSRWRGTRRQAASSSKFRSRRLSADGTLWQGRAARQSTTVALTDPE